MSKGYQRAGRIAAGGAVASTLLGLGYIEPAPPAVIAPRS